MASVQRDQFSNALILQGDWEGGLANFALDLMDASKKVTKVLLHAGDWIYKWKGVPTVSYGAPLIHFEDWLRNHIEQNDVDCIILYNQYRTYNAIGWRLAAELGLECIVLELGLLRPDFCSIYSRKRNQHAYLASRWATTLRQKNFPREREKPAQLAKMSTPRKMTQFAMYYLFSRFMATFARQYTHYTDQRTLKVGHHLMAGIGGMLRFQGRKRQSRFNSIFSTKWSGKYYFVPLQVHTDSQITVRSDFSSMEEFIQLVAESFLRNAPAGSKLIFKVHPMDRGYRDYRQFIKSFQARPGGRRIYYLDRIHLPTALDHARACITINSSVGLSALVHGTPLLTLGQAAFNLDGLTYRGSLDKFWTQHGRVNPKNVKNFVALLKKTSQAQGTLFQRLYAVKGRCKIGWPEEFENIFTEQPERIYDTPQERASNRSSSPAQGSQLQLNSTP